MARFGILMKYPPKFIHFRIAVLIVGVLNQKILFKMHEIETFHGSLQIKIGTLIYRFDQDSWDVSDEKNEVQNRHHFGQLLLFLFQSVWNVIVFVQMRL